MLYERHDMLVSEAISGINYALRGLDDDAPMAGTDEWNQWLHVLNQKKDELYRDVSTAWNESYEVRSLGTVTASATPSYNIPTDFLGAAGNGDGVGAYVVTTDGQRVNLLLVKPQEASSSARQVYISGRNPQTLTFTTEIEATENIVGGTLYLTGYFMPADMTSENDVVPLPNPQWGVFAAAGEIAFSDIIYENKATDINAKANNLYGMMKTANMRGISGAPRKMPYSIQRLGMS